MVNPTEKRKVEHLKLCATKDVAFREKTTLLECVELNYKTLPEISMADVNLSTNFLGKEFAFPAMASAITGGAQVSKKVNKDIALACQELGIGMGLGSIRAMLEQPSLIETYAVRDVAPDIFLAANIGAAQLKQYSVADVEDALGALEADALAIHLNAAQEAVQPEGDADFSGLIERIAHFAANISIPVYVKEVGHGISFEVAAALRDTKIRAIDVQGSGGTSWTAVDSLRHKKGFGKVFWDFGIPTAVSILDVRNAMRGVDKKVVASGGIRNGLEAVKALVLGADLVATSMPVLKAQQKGGSKGVANFFFNLKREMEIASFLLGCKNIAELHKERFVMTGKLKEWIKQ
jgi:isopentenyl-diphosphate delta-isomerase